MYGSLWSYSAVFSSSMTAYVSIPGLSLHHNCDLYKTHVDWTHNCEYTYLLFLAIYAVICVPLSCQDLTDQVILQVFLCLVRYAGIFVMYITVAIGLGHGPFEEDGSSSGKHDHESGPPYIADKTAFDMGGFGIMFTTAVFSQLIQHSAPGLSQPVKDKRKLYWIFAGGLSSTCILYLLLGLMASLYFGSDTKQLVSLNWTSYTGDGFDGAHNQKIFPKIISYGVILFPVVTVISAYPLLAITLGNNLYYGLPERWTDNYKSKKVKILCRLIASIPPVFGAAVLKKLAPIIEITGIAGCFVGFVFPGMLQWKSRSDCIRKWGEAGKYTPYTWHGSHPVYAWIIVVFGILALLYTVISEIISVA